jgi:hypothetical protein
MQLSRAVATKEFICAGISISRLGGIFALPEVTAGTLKSVPSPRAKLCRHPRLVYRPGNDASGGEAAYRYCRREG